MGMTEPEAAVAIVRACAPRESILLIRRSEREEDSWSGHWSFPGGRRDPGDLDLLHTALRELEEECGIRLDREQMQSELPHVLARRRAGPFVLVAPFVFGVDGELAAVVNFEEAVEAVWFPLSEWRDPARHTLRNVPGLPENWLFPAIDLNGKPVWGFTYRLAMDWLGLLPEQGSGEEVGFGMACRVLDFLLSCGLTLREGWNYHTAKQPMAEQQRVRLAMVEGVIPVERVMDRFAIPEEHFPGVNLLEIRPDCIRLAGLAFEEYLILASG